MRQIGEGHATRGVMSDTGVYIRNLAIAALLAAVGSAGAAEFPDKAGVVEFSTPSENIACRYYAKPTPAHALEDGAPRLSCDRANPTYVRVILGGAKGEATRRDNPSDQTCCSAEHTLAYGDHWKGGPFACASGKDGLECHDEKGHGLFLGLKAIRTH
jgi:hypothetical protein